MHVLGFMSGTSLDGVDAAIITTDGERIEGLGPALLEPYTPQERSAVLEATSWALEHDLSASGAACPPAAQLAVTAAHLRALDRIRSSGAAFELIGFHGQTLLHRPLHKLTIQIGDSLAITRHAGVPVITDVRLADLEAGGEGAPLVPVYHKALADMCGLAGPVAFLNLGGVANITWIGESLIAFDVGPGNGLMDQYLQARGLGSYDEGGRIAAQGSVDAEALGRLLCHPFLQLEGPKSLDRYDIGLEPVLHLSVSDAVRTLAAFTAACVTSAVRHLPAPPKQWLVCGGGRHNPVLMAELRARILATVTDVEAIGLRGDFIEAEAMAFIAARYLAGKPSTFPKTTGARSPIVAGRSVMAEENLS